MKRLRTGRKIENKKNFLPIRSNPTRVRKFQNKCKKILKNRKYHPGLISRRNGSGNAEKQTTKKNFLPIRSNPARVIKFKNKCKKILKIKKHHPGFISRRNESGHAVKQRTKKISFLSVRTRPLLENSKINAKKLKNIIQASFQDEASQDRPKNREQKKFPSYPFEPDSSQKIQK